MRVLTVIGARPQFIKAAAVDRAFSRHGIEAVVIHTGQHFDHEMSQLFFDELGLRPPDINLGIAGGSHGEMTGRMLGTLEQVMVETDPDWVLVYGDTNSTLAGGLAVSKLPIRLAHVEAGLRSFNRTMPEEINRVVVDHLSDVCLTPTATADENLRREGIRDERVVRTGDVMFDATRLFGERSESSSTIAARYGLKTDGFVLATVHRAENTDDPQRLKSAVLGLAALAADLPVVLPLHPRTKLALERMRLDIPAQLRILPPVGYLDMLWLEAHARLIATDSGGVQKEAFFYRRPCVTLREETEWVELVELGWNRLAPPTNPDAVAEALRAALEAPPGKDDSPYGDGNAADHIVEALMGRR